MRKNEIRTGKKVASIASKVLRNAIGGRSGKSVAGAALVNRKAKVK